MDKDAGKREVQISLTIDADGVPTMQVLNAQGISFEVLLTVQGQELFFSSKPADNPQQEQQDALQRVGPNIQAEEVKAVQEPPPQQALSAYERSKLRDRWDAAHR